MSDQILPRYPIYIPSKGRYNYCQTARFLIEDRIPFYLVVEPQEQDFYAAGFGRERLLILPWSGNDETRQRFCAERNIENGGLIAVRNWIKEHSIAGGFARHWQLDDNIIRLRRMWKKKRIPCNAGIALAVAEDFVDRYENVAIAGLNYEMFAYNHGKGGLPPFYVNAHVYSCSLILNSIPHRWRIAYNDDTDICLQVLADGWCTILINAFMAQKIRTMVVKGGNTTDLYQGDGRLKMARSLERLWPGVVETKRRWKRPQHVVRDNWRIFKTPLKLKPDVVLPDGPNEYDMKLTQVKRIKSAYLRELVKDFIE